jgi:hypothetical protein
MDQVLCRTRPHRSQCAGSTPPDIKIPVVERYNQGPDITGFGQRVNVRRFSGKKLSQRHEDLVPPCFNMASGHYCN